jgi:hypothetical protein
MKKIILLILGMLLAIPALAQNAVSPNLFAIGMNSIDANPPPPVWCPTDGNGNVVKISLMRLWDDGMKWGQVETSPNVYDFSKLDEVVNNLRNVTGCPIIIEYVFGDTPQWASLCASAGDPSTCLPGPTSGGYGGGTQCASPTDYSCTHPSDVNTNGTGTDAQFQAFVYTIMNRYKTNLGMVELYNESDSANFWCVTNVAGCNGQTAAYDVEVRMMWDAYKIAHCLNSNVQVVGVGVHVNSALTWWPGYVTASISAPAGSISSSIVNGSTVTGPSCTWSAQTVTGAQTFDIANFHGRGTSSTNSDPTSFLAAYTNVVSTVNTYNLPGCCSDSENGLNQGQAANVQVEAGYVSAAYLIRSCVGPPFINFSGLYQWDNGVPSEYQGTAAGTAFNVTLGWLLPGGKNNNYTVSGTVYKCSGINSSGKNVIYVFDTSQTCTSTSMSSCTTNNQSFGAQYTQYVDIAGVSHATTGGNGTAPVGWQPIMLISNSGGGGCGTTIQSVGTGTNSSGNTSVNNLTTSYTPTTGNNIELLLVSGANLTGLACADNNGNALTQELTSGHSWLFSGTAVAGASNYKCTETGATTPMSGIVSEYSGVNALGASATASGSSTTPSVSVTTTANNSYVYGGLESGTGTTTYTLLSGTIRASVAGGSGSANAGAALDNTAASSGTLVTDSATMNSSSSWNALGLELKPSTSCGNNTEISPIIISF